jgi:sulfonate transport system permease protein
VRSTRGEGTGIALDTTTTSPEIAVRMDARRRRFSSAYRSTANMIGIAVTFVVWELLAIGPFAGSRILPTPVSVARQMWDDRSFYPQHIHTTLAEAVQGYLWGNLLAIGLACLFVLIPVVESLLMRLAIASYCMPIIAIGPIFQIVYGGDTPKVILSALTVFFTTLIGTILGLRSADPEAIDAVRAFGGGNRAVFFKVRIPAALPSLFSALKIAAPAAILGAMIGEYLGGTSGLGVAIIVSEQSFSVPRTWGLAIVAAGLGGIGYGLTALIARFAIPWAPSQQPVVS